MTDILSLGPITSRVWWNEVKEREWQVSMDRTINDGRQLMAIKSLCQKCTLYAKYGHAQAASASVTVGAVESGSLVTATIAPAFWTVCNLLICLWQSSWETCYSLTWAQPGRLL